MNNAITGYPDSTAAIRTVTPEIVDPRIADIESVARWLDYAFELPGGFRFGLAGIIGLIPVLGDIIDALLSLYIFGRAVQIGVPRVALARMLVNVGIETAAGSVPVIGDLFDVAFKANRRNYRLLKSYLIEPRRQTACDWWFLMVVGGVLLAGVALPIVAIIELAKHL